MAAASSLERLDLSCLNEEENLNDLQVSFRPDCFVICIDSFSTACPVAGFEAGGDKAPIDFSQIDFDQDEGDLTEKKGSDESEER